jgi:hypothetical protein
MSDTLQEMRQIRQQVFVPELSPSCKNGVAPGLKMDIPVSQEMPVFSFTVLINKPIKHLYFLVSISQQAKNVIGRAGIAPHFCFIKSDMLNEFKPFQQPMSKPVTIKIKNGTVHIATKR